MNKAVVFPRFWLRTCKICTHAFIAHSPRAKYCHDPKCREIVDEQNKRRYVERRRKRKAAGSEV